MAMECSRCLFTDDVVKILPDGECEYCKLHDRLERDSSPEILSNYIETIRWKGQHKKYDCLIGISGGFDSSLLLEYAVKQWGLRPLVIHFDNGWNEPFAEDNMWRMVDALGVDFIRYHVDRKEYDNACKAFLAASVPDADIPNDIIMTKFMYETARKYNIKYILNGHCFRTEGSTPAKWTYMDAKYIKSVYKAYTRKEIEKLPLLTLKDQIRYGFLRIKHIRPFHHITFDREREWHRLIKEYGWMPYTLKHGENAYTAFIGYYWLPNKFNIDKRRVYLSAQIRSGILFKTEARKKLNFVDTEELYDRVTKRLNLGIVLSEYLHAPNKNHTSFETYNFKKWKFIIWILVKMDILPYTFYKKYCL